MLFPLFFPTDSYKFSHYFQYPPGTEKIHCYMETRSNQHYDKVYFWGASYYIRLLKDWVKTFEKFNRKKNSDILKNLLSKHGFPSFNTDLFTELSVYIAQHKKFPLKIYALPENKAYPIHTTLMSVENTDKKFFWLPTFVETFLLKIWYPATVATKSFFIKEMLTEYWSETSESDISGVDFQFHNFGDRGASSTETAYIGGQAHLQLFKGTDNFMASLNDTGNVIGYSIPAMEHSTLISWEKKNEFQAYEYILEKNKHEKMLAMVVDSYNTYEAVDFITQTLRKKIESEAYPTVVLRPDSGNPEEVIKKIIKIMEENNVRHTMNGKGYKIWDKYKLIWGDGINHTIIKGILELMKKAGYATENISFGSGAWLMQHCTRDTLGFAYKASAIYKDGKWTDIFKNPSTDINKLSKKGLQTTPDMNRIY